MARPFRHDDPRCGREHFDARAGVDWEWGPSPNETSYSIPDVPWNQLTPGSQLLFEKGQWAVTDFGLELLSTSREKYERYRIAANSLLLKYHGGLVYHWPIQAANEVWVDLDDFEGAFVVAIQIHCRRAAPEKPSKNWKHLLANILEQPKSELENCLANVDALERTFRRARHPPSARQWKSGAEIMSRAVCGPLADFFHNL